MSPLRKLASLTAIHGLSIVLLFSACSIEPKEALVGTWKTALHNGDTGMSQFYETGRLRTWAEPRPPEGGNIGRGRYYVDGDSLGLVGELFDTVLYSMHWADYDHLTVTGTDKTLVLTRVSK